MEWMSRFVRIMDTVSEAGPSGLSITALAEKTDITKGSLHRILHDMMNYDLIVQHDDTKRYSLGPQSMIWGSRFVNGRDISDLLGPYCARLSQRVRLYGFLCRFVANEVYCVYTHQPEQERRTYYVHVGQRMPLHASASAKAILAFQPEDKIRYLLEQTPRNYFTERTKLNVVDIVEELHEIRRNRIAWCREEMERGVSAVAVPIFGQDQTVMFSLSLIGNHDEIMANREKICQNLLEIEQVVEQQLRAMQSFTSTEGYIGL